MQRIGRGGSCGERLWRRGFPRRCGDALGQRQAAQFALREFETQVEFELVIRRLHVPAELVEGLVMRPLLQVRQFVDDDHAQKLGWHFLEQARHPDLALRPDPAALDAGDLAVHPQGIGRDL